MTAGLYTIHTRLPYTFGHAPIPRQMSVLSRAHGTFTFRDEIRPQLEIAGMRRSRRSAQNPLQPAPRRARPLVSRLHRGRRANMFGTYCTVLYCTLRWVLAEEWWRSVGGGRICYLLYLLVE